MDEATERDPALSDLAAYLELRRRAEDFLAARPGLQRLLLDIHRHWPPHVASEHVVALADCLADRPLTHSVAGPGRP